MDSPANRKRPISALGHSANKSASSIYRTSSFREAQKVYQHPLPRKQNIIEDVVVLKKDKKHSYRSDGKMHSKFKPSLEYTIGVNEKNIEGQSESPSPRAFTPGGAAYKTRNHSISDSDSSLSDMSDDEVFPEQDSALRNLTAKERDSLLCDIISVGDRIIISCPQKQPKYGKKKGKYVYHNFYLQYSLVQ